MDNFLEWFFTEIDLFVRWCYQSIFEALAAVMHLIPLPDFMTDLPSLTIPPSVSFYAQYFELEFGLEVIVSAYIARFILRRIPGIG